MWKTVEEGWMKGSWDTQLPAITVEHSAILCVSFIGLYPNFGQHHRYKRFFSSNADWEHTNDLTWRKLFPGWFASKDVSLFTYNLCYKVFPDFGWGKDS